MFLLHLEFEDPSSSIIELLTEPPAFRKKKRRSIALARWGVGKFCVTLVMEEMEYFQTGNSREKYSNLC